jgi:aminoglycoside phosphotransferase (APT) family kinase protein
MHHGQVTIIAETVQHLVRDQFPEWRDLPIATVTSAGTVNALFRIGEHLVARFPLTEPNADVEREVRATQEVLGLTRFPTPVPMAVGAPGTGYPFRWSIHTWLPGTVAFNADPGGSVAFAHDLAALIHDIRAINTRGRTHRDGRGGDLRAHDDAVDDALRRSTGLLDVARLRLIWNDLRGLPRADPGDVMCHGDLIPGNVLVADGRLAGVIDWGTFGPADPALDLVSAWHLLDAAPRQALRDALGSDDVEWERGKAWAFVQSVNLVWYYLGTNPTMAALGRRTLNRITAATI